MLLGVVSLLTDISSEMVAAALPLYLVYTLGFTPLQFGIVDGVYQGATALVRIGSGFLGDRTAPPQGGGRERLRPVGALQARSRAGGQRLGGGGRDHAARSHRQGNPDRATRCAHLAQQPPGHARAVVRGAPRARHHGRADRPAGGVRAAVDRAACLRLAVPGQLLHRGGGRGRARAVRRRAPAGGSRRRRRGGGPALDARCRGRPAAARHSSARGDRRRAGHGDPQRRLHLSRARGERGLPAERVPDPVRGHRPHLHGAGGAGGLAGGPDRPRPRVRGGLRAAAGRLSRPDVLGRGLVGDPALTRPARGLLRGHGRRA